MCLTSAECTNQSYPIDTTKNICSDCYTGSDSLTLSNLTCITGCAIGDYSVSQSGLRYCKEHDKTVTFTDNAATTSCTQTGSFGSDYFDPTKSEWSSSTFFIQQIQDANNLTTDFTFTLTGLGASVVGINRFQVNFTKPSEFNASIRDLKIVLNAGKSFGVLKSNSTVAKITGNPTVNNFNCQAAPTCTGATKYLDVSNNTCVSACGSMQIGLSSANSYSCLTPAECTNQSYPIDTTKNICSNCYTGSHTINLSDLTCITGCAIGDYSVSQSGLRYCKEYNKKLTFIDNSAATPCKLDAKFDNIYFNTVLSEWSSSSFFIKKIQDANNLSTTYTFTLTGLGATSVGINGFQVNFTKPREFDSPSKDLNIVLNASKSFGITQNDSVMAKIQGFGTTVNNFNCQVIQTNQTCTEGTRFLDVSSNSCVSSCGSKYIGLSSAKGDLCLTPSQCDSDSLVKDSPQYICSDCTGSKSIQRSILSCISNCSPNDRVSISSSLEYCAEETCSLTFSDFSETKANTQQGTLSKTFNVPKSVWSNSNFIIDKVSNIDGSKQFSFAIKGISADLPLSKFELEFTNPSEFSGKTQTLIFALKPRSFGFQETHNKFSSISVANTLDFPEFSNAESEIFITKHHLEIYFIEFSFDLSKTPPNGSWSNQVSINLPNMPPGAQLTYTVKKTASDSLTLEFDFSDTDIDQTTQEITVVYVKPGVGTMQRNKKTFEVGIVKYNEAYVQAASVMRAGVSVLDPAAGIMALSGSAMAHVAFNKLFMINNFRLQLLYPVLFPKNYKAVLMQLVNPIGQDGISQLAGNFIDQKTFNGVYTKDTANMWLVRPRVYIWACGVWTITRLIAKTLFALFALNVQVAPKKYCFSKKVESGRVVKWFRNKVMGYFFIAYFIPFFTLCLRSFGVFGFPGVAIHPSNGFLWFDLAILMTDLACMVYVMDFLRRYASGKNYSRFIPYTEPILQKILFLDVQDSEKNPKLKYYNIYRNCISGLMTLVTYGLQGMPWVLISLNVLIAGAWAVTIVRVKFFKSAIMYWWNVVQVCLLVQVHMGQIGFYWYETYGGDWGTYIIWATLQEYLLLTLLLMELLETFIMIFQRCRGMRCGSTKVCNSELVSPMTRRMVDLEFAPNKDAKIQEDSQLKLGLGTSRGKIFRQTKKQNPVKFSDDIITGTSPQIKKSRILPQDLGFIDHEQLIAARGDYQKNINISQHPSGAEIRQQNEAIGRLSIGLSSEETLNTRSYGMNSSQNLCKNTVPEDMSLGAMIESLDTPPQPPKTSIRMIVMPNVKKESAAMRKFSAMRIRSAKKDQLSIPTASLGDNQRLPGEKDSSLKRDLIGTPNHLPANSGRTSGDSQESARKIVNYNQTTFINFNLAEAYEHKALDLAGNSDSSNLPRRVPLKPRKINQKEGTQSLHTSNPRMNLSLRPRQSMLNPGAPLNDIAEDHNEWKISSPFESCRSIKTIVEPIAKHGFKLHPLSMSEVHNSDVPSNLKFREKSMTDIMPSKLEKNKHDKNDQAIRRSSNTDAIRLPSKPEKNDTISRSLKNFDLDTISDSMAPQQICLMSTKKVKRSKLQNQETRRSLRKKEKNYINDMGSQY